MARLVELYYSDQWNAVTDDTLARDAITITRGRKSPTQRVSPATCSLSFRNADGTYSPRNTSSALYGLIGRNTPVRVTVDGSVRCVGEIERWPQRWEQSGKDVWVPVTAYGITRRLAATGTKAPATSAAHRYIVAASPGAYWPMDTGAATAAGVPPMTRRVAESGVFVTQAWATAQVAHWLTPGASLAPLVYLAPSAAQFPTATTVAIDAIVRVAPDSDGASWGLLVTDPQENPVASAFATFVSGVPELDLFGSGGPALDTASAADAAAAWDDTAHHWRILLVQDGADIDVTVYIDGVEVMAGTQTTATIPATAPAFAVNAGVSGAVSDVAQWGETPPDVAEAAAAALGHAGETTATRLARLCTEESITLRHMAGNLAHDPRATTSGDVNQELRWSALWYGDGGGTGSTTLITTVSDHPAGIETAIRKTWTNPPSGNGDTGFAHSPGWAASSSQAYPVTPGQTLTVTSYLKPSVEKNGRLDVYWHEADGTQTLSAGTTVTLAAGEWTRLSRTFVVPADQVGATFASNITTGGSTWAAADTLDGSGLMVSHGPHTWWYGDGYRSGWEWSGTADDSPSYPSGEPLGPQRPLPVLETLHEAVDTDGGILYDSRDVLGLDYRAHLTLYSQTAAVTLDYDSQEVAPPLQLDEDSDLLVNDCTVTRIDGGSSRVEQATGTLGIDTVGRYPVNVSLSLADDDQTLAQAQWKVAVGTYDEPRFPAIGADVAGLGAAGKSTLADDVLTVDLGDRLVVTDPPVWTGPDDIDQLAHGVTEVIGTHTRTVTLATAPAKPYDVLILSDPTYGVLDLNRLGR